MLKQRIRNVIDLGFELASLKSDHGTYLGFNIRVLAYTTIELWQYSVGFTPHLFVYKDTVFKWCLFNPYLFDIIHIWGNRQSWHLSQCSCI